MATVSIDLHGHCAPDFAGLKDVFARQFADGEEIGARITLIRRGEVAVDLWAGFRDLERTKPWQDDTIVCIWSATKALIATSFAMLVDRGLMRYDDRVAHYWPEFAANGKQDVTVGMLLSNQSGLGGFADELDLEELFDQERAARRLAAQAPQWTPEPGKSGYHATTIGILGTELFRRIEGRSLKQFVAEEIAQPAGLDLSIGVAPGDIERVAEMQPVGMSMAWFKDDKLQQLAVANPYIPATMANDPRWYQADIASGNGYTNAHALAQFYYSLISPSHRPLLGPDALAQAVECRFEGHDLIKGRMGVQRWSAGFWLNSPRPDADTAEFRGNYGHNREAFGFSGWGGCFGFADPKADLSFAYTLNLMSDKFDADPRRRNLVDAVYASV